MDIYTRNSLILKSIYFHRDKCTHVVVIGIGTGSVIVVPVSNSSRDRCVLLNTHTIGLLLSFTLIGKLSRSLDVELVSLTDKNIFPMETIILVTRYSYCPTRKLMEDGTTTNIENSIRSFDTKRFEAIKRYFSQLSSLLFDK